ncbi:hypothetical protein P4234_18360 [Pseudomonas aeruginosa]|nr:hypothetical protein [Pseudomonas aeruginosa]
MDEILPRRRPGVGVHRLRVTEFIRITDRLTAGHGFPQVGAGLRDGSRTRAGTPMRCSCSARSCVPADNAALPC